MAIYKYIESQWLEGLKNNGSVLVNTLYNLRKEKEKIKDGNEGKLKIEIQPKRSPIKLSSTKTHYTFPNVHPTFDDTALMTINKHASVSSLIEVEDTFVFCASTIYSQNIQKRLGCDYCYQIIDKYGFADALCEALSNKYTIPCYEIQEITYSDKPLIIENQDDVEKIQEQSFWRLCLTKDRLFIWQNEIRMVFPLQFPKKIEPLVVNIPDIEKYCRF
jgi:hypothetical protein